MSVGDGDGPPSVELLRVSAAHVVVGSLDVPELDAEDAHHLARSLRLRDGELVTVTDGRGKWRPCRFRRAGTRLDAEAPIGAVAAPDPLLTIGFAPVKGERAEWTVQKLTELGVDRIVPLHGARSVVRWEGARATTAVARL
jgi:16S rRNA (uracil1498-N3)-methyltransferase